MRYTCSYSHAGPEALAERGECWSHRDVRAFAQVPGPARTELVNRPPGVTVASQQFVGRGRTLAAGRVPVEVFGTLRPGIQNRLYHFPAGLDVISALEQRGVS